MRKLIIGSFLGNSLEWYDFSCMAPRRRWSSGRCFSRPRMTRCSVHFSLFRLCHRLYRPPLGGVIFGHLGDRYSRKMTLIITLTLMGASTFLIGLLPTYAHIGILAPIALITLRFVQGVASGGEWGGGVLMLSENAPESQKGYYTAGAGGGLRRVCSFFAGILSGAAAAAGRGDVVGVAYSVLLSLFIFLVGVYIRRNIRENAEFVARKAENDSKMRPIIYRCSAPSKIIHERYYRLSACGWRKTARCISSSRFQWSIANISASTPAT